MVRWNKRAHFNLDFFGGGIFIANGHPPRIRICLPFSRSCNWELCVHFLCFFFFFLSCTILGLVYFRFLYGKRYSLLCCYQVDSSLPQEKREEMMMEWVTKAHEVCTAGKSEVF